MKVKEIDIRKLAHYLKKDLDNYDVVDRKNEEEFLNQTIKTAKEIVRKNNGLTIEEVEESETLSIAVLLLCSEMDTNRSLNSDKNGVNKVLDITLGLDDKNLL